MALDLYHQILKRLLEQTGGNEKAAVNLQELARKEGYGGAYNDIQEVLSREGWTADAPRTGHVFLTHWGMAEIRRVDKPPAPKTEAPKPAEPAPPPPAPAPEDPATLEARRLASLARAVADAFEAEARERSMGAPGDARRQAALARLEELRSAASPPPPAPAAEPVKKKTPAKKG